MQQVSHRFDLIFPSLFAWMRTMQVETLSLDLKDDPRPFSFTNFSTQGN